MNTIVVNTLSGGVTEYTWGLTSVTPNFGGSPAGVCSLGGDTDAGAPITSTVVTGSNTWGTMLRKTLSCIYFSLAGTATGLATVTTRTAAYEYEFPIRARGVSRAIVGRGIRENYMAFGFRNVAGEYFRLDAIELNAAPSNTRKV